MNGCATSVKPSELAKPSSQTTVTLSEGYSFVFQFGGICKPRVSYGLIAGSYTAEYEDASGIYLRGPTQAVINKVLENQCADKPDQHFEPLNLEGGIYLSKASSKPSKIYFYRPVNASLDPLLTGYILGKPNASAQAFNQIAQQNTIPDPNIYKTAQVTAAGGAIGGAIVSAMIESQYGVIDFNPFKGDGETLDEVISANKGR